MLPVVRDRGATGHVDEETLLKQIPHMFRNVNLLDLFVGVEDEDGIADVDQLLNHRVLALADELQHDERSTWFDWFARKWRNS